MDRPKLTREKRKSALITVQGEGKERVKEDVNRPCMGGEKGSPQEKGK